MQKTIIAEHGSGSKLARAVGNDRKGKMSVLLYSSAIPLAFVNQWASDAIYLFVAVLWLVPDKRIESRFGRRG